MHLTRPALLLAGALVLAGPILSAADSSGTGDKTTEKKTGKTQAFAAAQLDQVPAPVFMARPQYPADARKAKRTGEVIVGFIVDSRGNVVNARVVRSTAKEFEAAAVEAVSKWKFKPGRKGGRDVATNMQVPIVFSLDAPKK